MLNSTLKNLFVSDSQNNYALQYFGQDSICVNHDTYAPWISIVGGFYRDISFPYASCHKVRKLYTCTNILTKLISFINKQNKWDCRL